MSHHVELCAELRETVGKGASRRLRRLNDQVPGILYGAGQPAKCLSFEHRHIVKALESEAFYSQLVTLKVGKESQKVILKDLQRHPYKPRIMHLDFMRVSDSEKLTIHVPLHFLNDDTAPGVKEGGIVSHLMIDVEISCLPKDLPEFIEVDLGALNMDESVHLSELKLPAGVELTAFGHGGDEHAHDQAVASIHAPRAVLADEDEENAEAAASDEAGEADEAAASDGDEA